jgi:hypothetical protein
LVFGRWPNPPLSRERLTTRLTLPALTIRAVAD